MLVSIRPWQVGLAAGDGPVAGEIVLIHRAGAHLRYGVHLADRTVEVLAPAAGEPFIKGQRVTLDLSAAHVFRVAS